MTFIRLRLIYIQQKLQGPSPKWVFGLHCRSFPFSHPFPSDLEEKKDPTSTLPAERCRMNGIMALNCILWSRFPNRIKIRPIQPTTSGRSPLLAKVKLKISNFQSRIFPPKTNLTQNGMTIPSLGDEWRLVWRRRYPVVEWKKWENLRFSINQHW